MHDLNPFEVFLNQIASDMYQIEQLAISKMEYYNEPNDLIFKQTIELLRNEISDINDTRRTIFNNFAEYKSLQARPKRSLFSFLGEVLFGTVSQSDLNVIRDNIDILAQNQKDIHQDLEEFATTLNVSLLAISDNRQSIKEVVLVLETLETTIKNFEKLLKDKYTKLQHFVNLYAQFDMFLNQLQQLVERAVYYIDNVKLELNMLSLSHLSPSTITPKSLQFILNEVESQLPTNLRLPADPKTDTWYFYKTLTCNTLLEGNKLIIVI